MSQREYIDLNELQSLIREGLEDCFPIPVWVKAEISSLKAKRGGHCYLELSQSDEAGTLLAKVKAIIWAGRYRVLENYFASVTGTDLQEGMTLLFNVQINYSELYGLSLIVNDIDASAMLGAQEEARRRTLARLEAEGRFKTQKALALSPLPYRVAVISAEDAAGYRDFMRHLHENEYGFVFETTLYPAMMQGVQAPLSIAQALEQVQQDGQADVVMILRGGGSNLDLLCFDDYELAVAIADCSIPVLTAVGHDQDFHICDQVAYDFVKTPTALADWLLDIYKQEDEYISSYISRLSMAFYAKLSRMESRVDMLESRILAADPRNILKRGYVLAVDGNGTVLKRVAALSKGDAMTVHFPDGCVHCRVETLTLKQS
ncbi:MAG: exodeoxyribonuclease VII large subunit [Bacteroidales bacterium]|nr:exodeoxyribonuclease VII large subunit [Bacteroidales bacterium]